MKLYRLFAITCLLTFAGAAPAFAENQPAITEVRKVGELGNAPRGAACVDEDISVALRGFGTWLAKQVDLGYFDEDPAIKAAAAVPIPTVPPPTMPPPVVPVTNGPAAVAWILKNRRLHDVLEQFANAETRHEGKPLTEKQWKDEWEAVSKDQVDSWIKPGGGSATELTESFKKFFIPFVRAKLAELTLCMDGEILTGVQPSKLGLGAGLESWKSLHESTQNLHFSLRQISRTSDSWKKLTSVPKFAKRVRVSLALKAGTTNLELPTKVEAADKDGFEFALNLIPTRRFLLAAALFVAMAWLLVHLARTRDLLRDPDGGWRPDGRRAFSLSRLQMAVWTLVVVGSFLFLWVVTSRLEMNSTALALIGIGAGTLLGASVISDSAKRKVGPYPFSYAPHEPDEKFLETLNKEIAKVTDAQTSEPDPAKKAEFQTRIDALNAQRRAYEEHYQQLTPLARVMQDLLCEENIYSFHRYQMMLWTVSLVIVFVVAVAVELVMPTFNETLLALVGISSGLYMGLKWQDVQKSNTTPGQ